MKKIVYLGRVKVGKFQRRVFLEVELEQRPVKHFTAPVLSIMGVIGPLPSGNCYGDSGQILNSISGNFVIREIGDLNRKDIHKLLKIWRLHHLNNMKVGCVHQRARGETWANNPDAVCPDCGHVLGHSWEYEPLPQDVIDFINALPESSIPYPWR
jgi:hypothetical protein